MSIFEKLLDINQSVSGLTPELKAIYIYNLYLESHSLLVVTSSLYEANMLYQRIEKYTEDVLFFPMDDFLTSEALFISPDLEMTRLSTLKTLSENSKKIVVTNLMGYLRYLPTKKIYTDNILQIRVNDTYEIKDLVQHLIKIGYKKESTATKTGEIAVRGFILDIFPITENHPFRIEFWDNTIESIRSFDESSQLSLSKNEYVKIYPTTEFIVDNKDLKYRKIKELIDTTSIINYLNKSNVVFDNYNSILENTSLLKEEINNYNIDQQLDINTKYMYDFENINVEKKYYINDFNNSIDSVKKTQNYESFEIIDFPTSLEEISKKLEEYIKNRKTIIICLENRYKINKLIDTISNIGFILTNEQEIFENKINVIEKSITTGFIFEKYIFLSETEIFNKKNINVKYSNKIKYGTKIRDINKLEIGDYVVHNLYGIGKYTGIRTIEKNGLKKDYITVEYRDEDKLYIPVEKIEFINKYSSNDGIAPILNKLGSSEWEKTKARVRKNIKDIASDLLRLYALRESSKGFAFLKDDELQLQFEKEFPYTETEDQIKVTEEIKKDMEKPKPMDRLLCGDVGFGKTEIAFRAAFKAILSKKQVAYLCPTTILSSQHYSNAIERFKNFGVEIELLNRFVSSKKVKQIKNDLKTGRVDFVIGTHKLLANDIEFKDLGLLIIDEEHRFGVKQKEKLKELKNNIDVLTLSATPIPRTLQMSMIGVRNLSLLETPPVDRFPIQTYVLEENIAILKDAIYKELSRNGQVFILYNYIKDIEIFAKKIIDIVPEARTTYAHGRMDKNQIENTMQDFINHKFDILVSTSIIETGIDIPNANTLIIIDADKFGLSQLYQIRGRVGRTNKIAYCYLMYKKNKNLNEIVRKRLNVIKEFTQLGSGFSIATRDLSIRGAGNILGSKQAGFIDDIGIELYLKMLNEEINKINGKETNKNLDQKQLEKPLLEVETFIDDNYVSDTDLKLEIHKKINEIDSIEKMNQIKKELTDRFGKLNDSLIIYMYEEWFEKLALKLNIKNVVQTKTNILITIEEEVKSKLNIQDIFFEVSNLSRMFRFSMKKNELIITLDIIKLDKHFIYYLIDLLKIIEKNIKK